MFIALDSGAIKHVANAKDVPSDAIVAHTEESKGRDFVAANGGSLINHGETAVRLTTEDDSTVGSTFNITDVTRPLHAVSQMADQGNDILIDKGAAYVVPAGVVQRVLREWKTNIRVKYPRRGGLYVGRFRARAGMKPPAAKAGDKQPAAKQPSGFTRRGGQR